ncbi:DsbA family protein [Rickettsia oklahomensis]|uniref:DsbA family protein n=1 Tax=Rickettsia oklahomensis TaxID=3141789 RepID=A0AAU7BZN4_9RICK
MRSIFIVLVFLLFLSSYSEAKAQDQNHGEKQIIEQETIQNNETSQEINQEAVNSKNAAKLIVPANDSNQTNELPTPDSQEQKNPETKPIKVTFKVDDYDMVLGNKKSNVIVVEYFSPTCPHCAYYHQNIFPELKKKYIDTNKIAYVVREFIGTKQDLDAAILARCKGDISSFIQFHNIILKQQDKWAYSNKYRELLTDIGQLGGISPEEYQQCLNSEKITEILIANTNLVAKVPKFIGTPSLFVNGVQTKNYSIDNISATVDKALDEQKEKAKNEMNL